jgi:hypothetical protein
MLHRDLSLLSRFWLITSSAAYKTQPLFQALLTYQHPHFKITSTHHATRHASWGDHQRRKEAWSSDHDIKFLWTMERNHDDWPTTPSPTTPIPWLLLWHPWKPILRLRFPSTLSTFDSGRSVLPSSQGNELTDLFQFDIGLATTL